MKYIKEFFRSIAESLTVLAIILAIAFIVIGAIFLITAIIAFLTSSTPGAIVLLFITFILIVAMADTFMLWIEDRQ